MFAFLSFVFLLGGIVEVGMWLIEVAALSGVDGATPEAVFVFIFLITLALSSSSALRSRVTVSCVCRSDGAHRCVHR